MDFPIPKFAHIPLILSPTGGKLSKRHSHTSVDHYISKNYLPEALVNFIVLLGWRPITEDLDEEDEKNTEIFSMKELITLFDLSKVSAANAKLDESKLIFFNQHYMKEYYSNIDNRPREKVKVFKEKLHIYLPDCKQEIDAYDDFRMKEMIKMTLERIKLYEELVAFRFFFKDPDFKTEESQKTREKVFKNPEKSAKLLKELTEIVRDIPEDKFTMDTISKEVATYHHKQGKELKHEDLYHLLRFVLTGSKSGATATKIMEILGKETTMKRLSVWVV